MRGQAILPSKSTRRFGISSRERSLNIERATIDAAGDQAGGAGRPQDIATYIAQNNPDRAVAFIDELIAKMERIRHRPMSYPARSEGEAGLRGALHGRYLIIYRVRTDLVEVLRVVHGARDIAALF
ncbi:MAG TPA: type II toxin-antitoxin system RelE/ParE family toxin [Novosphingobium sp.]